MRSTAKRVKLEREYANCLHILDELAKVSDPYRRYVNFRYVNFQFPATSQPGEIWALHHYFKARALRAESELKHLGDRTDHGIAQLKKTERELLPIAQDVCRKAMQRFELRITGLIQGFPELMAPTESTAALTPTRKSPNNQLVSLLDHGLRCLIAISPALLDRMRRRVAVAFCIEDQA